MEDERWIGLHLRYFITFLERFSVPLVLACTNFRSNIVPQSYVYDIFGNETDLYTPMLSEAMQTGYFHNRLLGDMIYTIEELLGNRYNVWNVSVMKWSIFTPEEATLKYRLFVLLFTIVENMATGDVENKHQVELANFLGRYPFQGASHVMPIHMREMVQTTGTFNFEQNFGNMMSRIGDPLVTMVPTKDASAWTFVSTRIPRLCVNLNGKFSIENLPVVLAEANKAKLDEERPVEAVNGPIKAVELPMKEPPMKATKPRKEAVEPPMEAKEPSQEATEQRMEGAEPSTGATEPCEEFLEPPEPDELPERQKPKEAIPKIDENSQNTLGEWTSLKLNEDEEGIEEFSVEERCINQTKMKFNELLESEEFEISDEYMAYFYSTVCRVFVRAQDAMIQLQNRKSEDRVAKFMNVIEEKFISFPSLIHPRHVFMI
eukprot:TRINITY_DN1521_c0_g1_i3.p1 TRINITY_DN1521_c0_g1~~TRINITY_DN1521_c0_g1_i3.p1  ORF type:complete len:432 (-),score=101.86 TRINITY_DN1521_c0_g1_i3:358-1653(-)